jgi:hypothetical protein
MSLIDRWLSRSRNTRRAMVATSATSATRPSGDRVSAELPVATGSRQAATFSPVTPGPPAMSQSVAEGLQHETPRNPAAFQPLSQVSHGSTRKPIQPTPLDEQRTATVDQNDGTPRKSEAPPPEPKLIAPASWFERCVPPAPGEPPHDQPCPSRRGRIERQGGAFLHFCVVCGAWGAFGYGAVGDQLGRWYCREHRPKDEMR